MATSYPGAIDSFSDPQPEDTMDGEVGGPGVYHDLQHTNANDAIIALQNVVGVLGSYNFVQAGEGALLLDRTSVVNASTYTAAVGTYVPFDTTLTAIAVTLPNAPADQSQWYGKIVALGSGNYVTITTQGIDVFNAVGGSTVINLQLLDQGVFLQYDATNAIWTVIVDDLPLAQLDSRYSSGGGGSYLPLTGGTLSGNLGFVTSSSSSIVESWELDTDINWRFQVTGNGNEFTGPGSAPVYWGTHDTGHVGAGSDYLTKIESFQDVAHGRVFSFPRTHLTDGAGNWVYLNAPPTGGFPLTGSPNLTVTQEAGTIGNLAPSGTLSAYSVGLGSTNTSPGSITYTSITVSGTSATLFGCSSSGLTTNSDTSQRYSDWVTDSYGAPIAWLANYDGFYVNDLIHFAYSGVNANAEYDIYIGYYNTSTRSTPGQSTPGSAVFFGNDSHAYIWRNNDIDGDAQFNISVAGATLHANYSFGVAAFWNDVATDIGSAANPWGSLWSNGTGTANYTVTTTGATAGTFTITIQGYTTATFNWNDSAATLLSTLSDTTHGPATITVTGPGTGPGAYVIKDTTAARTITANFGGLTGGTNSITGDNGQAVVWLGADGLASIQRANDTYVDPQFMFNLKAGSGQPASQVTLSAAGFYPNNAASTATPTLGTSLSPWPEAYITLAHLTNMDTGAGSTTRVPPQTSMRPTNWFAETIPRQCLTSNTVAAATNGYLRMTAIYLAKGVAVGHINFVTGTTPSANMTHSWMGLYDLNRHQLAMTDDQTTNAYAASTAYSIAITNIATYTGSGSAITITGSAAGATWTTLYSGLYYIGLVFYGSSSPTSPTLQGSGGTGVIPQGLAPVLGGTSDTGITGTWPAFDHQAATLTGIAMFYAGVS